MRKILASIIVTIGVVVGFVGMAGATPSYCGNSPYDISYKAIYQYPTGSYWVNQIHAYPTYYAAYNAYYQSHYGC